MSEFASFKKTPFLSKKTIKDHLGLLDSYRNNIEKLTKENKKPKSEESNPNKSLYRTHLMQCRHNYNAEVLHRLYFEQIADKKTTPSKLFKNFLEKTNKNTKNWKDYEGWKKDFIGTAKAARGWAVLGYSVFEEMLFNVAVDVHDEGLPPGFFPILVLDVWEHAYIGDFGTDRDRYIKEWFKYINWDTIEATIAQWQALFTSEDLLVRTTASLRYKMHLVGV